MARIADSKVKTMIWDGSKLKLIDQRKLPFEKIYIKCETAEDIALAIKDMVVRGAPAIGVTASYGVAIAANEFKGNSISDFDSFMEEKTCLLAEARPTAVNLFWAIEKMKKAYKGLVSGVSGKTTPAGQKNAIEKIKKLLIKEAEDMEIQDVKINKGLSANGLGLIKQLSGLSLKLTVLTHCNAGALATAGYGTALGVIRSLNAAGLLQNVIVDETRPYMQGARLTAWELAQEKIPYFVISDNMAGYFMDRGDVDIIITGADRVAANGDTANKIGTLSLSILAKYYNIPFYIAAPVSTIDINTPDGKSIIIEQRPHEEIKKIAGCRIMPDYMPVSNPSFDVTPNENISAIITEKGNIFAPFEKNIQKIFKL